MTMRYFRAYGPARYPDKASSLDDDDPLSGLANLFDIGLVFIVGLIVTLFASYHLHDLLNEKTNLTIMKQTEDGEMEIIAKKGKTIKAARVSQSQVQGRGARLGVAYRLEDGSTVYVPDQSHSYAGESQ
mgnify:CR=1 FL=1